MNINTGKNLQNSLLQSNTDTRNCPTHQDHGVTKRSIHTSESNSSIHSDGSPSKIHLKEKELVKKLTIFPLFGDPTLAKLSLNYYLYFEFYRSAIRLLIPPLLFSALIYFLFFWAPSKEVLDSYKNGSVAFLNFYRMEIDEETGTAEIDGSQTFVVAFFGIISNFLFVYFWTREKTRMLHIDFLYDNQWSEDLFSLLVEGLPINITQEEVKNHFSMIISNQEIGGHIQDVILLQDCYKLDEAQKKLKMLKKRTTTTASEIQIVEEEIRSRKEELIQKKNHQGKAIVVFDTMKTRKKVAKYLTVRWYELPLLLFSKNSLQKCYFKEQRLTVRETPEPNDMYFENIHFPKVQGYIRMILAEGLGLGILCSGLMYIMDVEGKEEEEENEHDPFYKKVYGSLYTALTVALFDHILVIYYKRMKRISKPIDALKMDEGVLNFGLLLSVGLFLSLQAYSLFDEEKMDESIEDFANHFTVIVVVLLIKSVVVKYFQHREEFEFIEGVTVTFPLLIIGFCFVAISPFVILPLAIFGLLIMAIIDKHSVRKCKEHPRSKSTRLVMYVFTVFKFIPVLIWLSNSLIVFRMMKKYTEYVEEHKANLIDYANSDQITAFVCIVFGLFLTLNIYILWPTSMHDHMKERFYDKKSTVAYKEVCDEFYSTYRGRDPQFKTGTQQEDHLEL